MSVVTITKDDFVIINPGGQKTLGLRDPSVTIIAFVKPGCKACSHAEPILKSFAAKERRATVGLCNVQNIREYIVLSKETSTPILSTPTIIVYVKHRPLVKLKPSEPPTEKKLFEVVSSALQRAEDMGSSGNFAPQPGYQPSGYGIQQGHSGYSFQGSTNQQSGWTQPRSGGVPAGALKSRNSDAPKGGFQQDDSYANLLEPTSMIAYNCPWREHADGEEYDP